MTRGPRGVQRRRTAGWRMPEGAKYVGRPTKWGNPFRYRSPSGLVRYRPDHPDECEYEGRVSADGYRHPYYAPDGTVTDYRVRYATRAETVELYRRTLIDPDRGMLAAYPSNRGHLVTYWSAGVLHTVTPAMIRAELAGADLVCWCPLDQPCHRDVLLAIANG